MGPLSPAEGVRLPRFNRVTAAAWRHPISRQRVGLIVLADILVVNAIRGGRTWGTNMADRAVRPLGCADVWFLDRMFFVPNGREAALPSQRVKKQDYAFFFFANTLIAI